jgi:hypothetical protein
MTQANGDNKPSAVDVLTDLLGSEDFPAEVLDPVGAAKIILGRLEDAGFDLAAGMKEVRRLRAEIERLEAAKRRALELADERAKEANALRRDLAGKKP